MQSLVCSLVRDSDGSWGSRAVFIDFDYRYLNNFDEDLSILSLSKLDEFELRGLCDNLCQILERLWFTEVNASRFSVVGRSARIVQIESFKSFCRTIPGQDLHQFSSLGCSKHAIVHGKFYKVWLSIDET